ncbi:redoxin domain-containing protein [Thermotoga profunda]|uniref:redoxin domain-containing protein n=1 Tax=Thermotoga profunda TaxID=1508420 RepID=UPI000597DB05|nr:redoxin domain-containing protein [Thermotoga profunda]
MKIVKFNLVDQDNRKTKDTDLIGKYTVLYFFPKAGTTGCTKEAQDFSKAIEWFESRKTQIYGISKDSPEVLKNFKEKYQLKVNLLSDENCEFANSLNVQKDGKIVRSTFILDCWNRIRWSMFNVKVDGHVEKVEEQLEKIIQQDKALNELIELRRARRALSEDKISDEQLEVLLKAAHLAPSCSNKQPWRFIVVRSQDTLTKLHEALSGGNYWMKKAPVLIVVHSKKDMDCQLSDNRDYFLFDLGQAVAFLQIQATQMGLVAHPVAGFDPMIVKKILPIPQEHTVITILAIAYPTGDLSKLSEKHQVAELSERDRQPLENVVHVL